jgi:ornithine carbamoyltransferase
VAVRRHGRLRTRSSPPCASLTRLPRHFLTGHELSSDELNALIDRAIALKAAPLSSRALEGKSVALIFERPSTRTRLSFEAGVFELGGHPMILRPDEMQLSRGESVRDTAYILSRHSAAIGIRTGPDAVVEELAHHASVPVINMLTALHHPVQALADFMTLKETFGRLAGLTLSYVGDGNNVARSLAIVGAKLGVEVRVAAPIGYQLEPVAGAVLTSSAEQAATGADALYTDVWVSMNDEPETAAARRAALAGFQLNEELMALASPDVIALHCLPAHPGEEITEGLLYGPRQRIWDEAENRRHAQKALLEIMISEEL